MRAQVRVAGGYFSSCLVLLVAFSLAACRGRGTVNASDTEQRKFSVRCAEGQKNCELQQVSGPRARAGMRPVLRANGRLIGVCDAGSESAPVHLADCRPLTCAADTDCPLIAGAADGACVGSWCVDPAHAISTEDAVMLCLAGTGLGHEAPNQIERYALGLNCGEPCQIPAPCRQF